MQGILRGESTASLAPRSSPNRLSQFMVYIEIRTRVRDCFHNFCKKNYLLVDFRTEVPLTCPSAPLLRADVVVRWLAAFSGHKDDIPLFLNIISKGWDIASDVSVIAHIQQTMATVFLFLAGVPLTATDLSASVFSSGATLFPLVDRCPPYLLDQASEFVANVTSHIKDEFILGAVKCMLSWSQTPNVARWLKAVLDGLCSANKIELLVQCTEQSAPVLLTRIHKPRQTVGCLLILRRLLLGYQTDPTLFHSLIPSIIEQLGFDATKSLVDKPVSDTATEQSDPPLTISPDPSKAIQTLAEMSYALMHCYPG
jgi:hypothetical protein